MDNLKALLILQLLCCSCCLASFWDQAGYDHLKVSGGLGGLCMAKFDSAYSHFGEQRHTWILPWLVNRGYGLLCQWQSETPTPVTSDRKFLSYFNKSKQC